MFHFVCADTQCASTPGKLKSLPDHGGQVTASTPSLPGVDAHSEYNTTNIFTWVHNTNTHKKCFTLFTTNVNLPDQHTSLYCHENCHGYIPLQQNETKVHFVSWISQDHLWCCALSVYVLFTSGPKICSCLMRIQSYDNYVIWSGSLALMNREPITLRILLMRARLQDQKVCVT
jgi:hypothetical protein